MWLLVSSVEIVIIPCSWLLLAGNKMQRLLFGFSIDLSYTSHDHYVRSLLKSGNSLVHFWNVLLSF